jgi:hypothetical protein
MGLYVTDPNGKLVKIAGGIGSSILIDTELDENSVNPVQNKVITRAINTKANQSAVDELVQTINTKADTSYVDQKVTDLVGAAPSTLDTLEELANALKDNADVVDVLEKAIGNKADKTALTELSNVVNTKATLSEIAPTITFAESERQKSKNLFNYRDYLNLVSLYDYRDGAGYHCKRIALKPNTTYTVSYPTKEATSTILLVNIVENVNAGGYLDTRPEKNIKTYTTDSTGYLYIGVVNSDNNTINSLLSTLKLQIEEGTVATDYQEYNGEIVHEKDVAGLKGQVLWENSTPTVDFAAQTVTLSTDNYDYLEIIYRYSTDYNWQQSMFVEKGAQLLLQTINTPNMLLARITGIVNGNSLEFEKAFLGQNGHESVYNNYLIPVKIIGYKRS